MPSPTTSVNIASNALVLLGDNPISSFQDPGNGATVMANIYESTLNSVLSEHYWRFAVKKQTLSRLLQEPLNGYRYQFQLPADFIMANRVHPISGDYQIFEDKIHTNAATLDLDYVFRPNESAFPPYFVKLMEYRLATDAAEAVTGQQAIAQEFEAKYMAQFNVATSRDSQNTPNVAIVSNPFLFAHLGDSTFGKSGG